MGFIAGGVGREANTAQGEAVFALKPHPKKERTTAEQLSAHPKVELEAPTISSESKHVALLALLLVLLSILLLILSLKCSLTTPSTSP